ncbi:ABC transporter ATP-binding protein [bacterium]|nr:ABC transporter ATP-binding protein [bacterium]
MSNDIHVTVENVWKSFVLGDKVIEVLKGISCVFEQGTMVAITGVSGVGKSTLLHILGILDYPSSGRIGYNGVDPFGLSSQEQAHFRNTMIGFVFQAHHLLPEFSACENIMIPLLIQRNSRQKARAEAVKLLELVGLADRLEHKPGELSGGEQQRVAVARALVHSPRVILADEPTGNLDVNTGRTIHNLLKMIHTEFKITVIIATHNLELAAETDRQLQLVEGRLIEM